jgi:MFS superfamily sulfate permease-like transporter
MLMSIGVIIFAKQSHVGLGVTPHSKGIFGLLGEIPQSFLHMNPEIALIGVGSLLIVVGLGMVKNPLLKKIPAPLVAVLFGVAMGMYFDIAHEHMVKSFMGDSTVGPKFLLNVPDNIRDAIAFPDFGQIATPLFWKHVMSIMLVASIESILSAYAVDKLDRYKRVSDLNRELWSKGICNTVCGAIGALPIIAEIVRSSANVSNGAKTRWSNFFHGCFLLLFVVLFPALLHRIPLASLAAILVVTGYRLGNPKQLGHAWQMGWDQWLVMFTTLLVTLGTDLLIGVASGFVLELALNFVRTKSLAGLFQLRWRESSQGGQITFKIESPFVSTNFIRIRQTLNECLGKKEVAVDLSDCSFIDHTVMEHLERYEADGHAAGTPFSLIFSKKHVGVSSHPLAGRRLASR